MENSSDCCSTGARTEIESSHVIHIGDHRLAVYLCLDLTQGDTEQEQESVCINYIRHSTIFPV